MSILATELDWPEGTNFFEVQCRLGIWDVDGWDADKAPEVKTLGGTVRITPRTPTGRIRLLEPDGKYRVVVAPPLTFAINEFTGKLVNTADNTEGVWVVDPASDTVDPKDFTYSAVVTPKVGSPFTVEFDGTVAINGVYDLANGTTVAPSRGVSVLESRIAKLELEGAVKVGGSAPNEGLWLDLEGLTPVTAQSPVWDDYPEGGGAWTTPIVEGVTYSPATGTAAPGQTVVITATAKGGYSLVGTSVWTHKFPNDIYGPSSIVATRPGALATSTESLGSYTFAGLPIGPTGPNRTLLALVFGRKADPAATITNITISGVPATIDAMTTNAGSTAAVARAVIPSGTSGDVVVTFSAPVLRASVDLVSATSDTPIEVRGKATSEPTGNVDSCTVSVPTVPQGLVAASFGNGGSSDSPIDWTGVSELSDAAHGTSRVSTAMHASTANETRAVTASKSISSTTQVAAVLAAVSYR